MNQNEGQKIVVIGGLTGGIGSALAEQLRANGHRVLGYARSESDLEDSATLDATQPDALAAYLNEVQTQEGRIDAYIHAIGSIYLKPAHLTPPADFEAIILQNLSTAFYALRAATKLMQKQGAGSCLFFSTAAAQTGLANHEAIAAAKGGIEAMVRSAAATYAPRGLRINAIAPSLTRTPLAKPIIGSEQALEISKRMHPLGDIIGAEEVASLAAWLVSDAARLVTGQTFVIDGGISSIVPKPRA
ncbi:MAG: SDR family oxidoreductase [Verrucomicrobiota bacterium]